MEFDERQSIYLQITDHVRESILRGWYVEGERIPSVRELAMETEVNPNTVARSYAQLQEQGIIHNQRGIGYFVSEGALERTRHMKMREFVQQDLPEVFKTMELIGMDLEEFRNYYESYKKESQT